MTKPNFLLLLIFLTSLPIKFAAAQNMPFDIDIVPVLQRNLEYPLPPVGTLSSVAAYNMPMLEWLHLPLLHVTQHAWWTIFLSLSLFNLLGTFAVFKLSEAFFGTATAYAVAALFTFSEVGISSSYTAWAQLLLPTFFALTLYCLWLWHTKENGLYLALAGIIATTAFMTHFSAILLYPAMLVFALVNRSKWQWRWLFIGGMALALMLAPYMLFEAQRGFVDLKAFLSQETLVAPETLDQYRSYSYPTQPTNTATDSPSTSDNQQRQPSSRFERVLAYLLSVPSLLFNALQAAFPIGSRGLDFLSLPFIGQIVFAIPMLLFWLGLPLAIWRRDEGARHYGRMAVFLAVILLLMALTRTLDDTTYLMGFISVQTIMAGYAIHTLFFSEKTPFPNALGKGWGWGLLLVVLLFCALQVGERAGRLLQHEDSDFSPYNVSLYRHISAAVDAIAADWEGGDTLTVSYDILPEMPNLWWTPAWNSIDPSYRMGMNFDFLLSFHHGLNNANQDPVGTVEDTDYIVIYSPAAERYTLSDYEIWRFGAIWVLKTD
jgi:hypothetical protein